MPRTKVGLQGGFLDDRQFVDGLKVMFFVGTFYTVMKFVRGQGESNGTKHIMSLIMYLLTIPGISGTGAKSFMNSAVDESKNGGRYPGAPKGFTEAVATAESLPGVTPWEGAEMGAEAVDPIVQSTGYDKSTPRRLSRVRRIPGRVRESKAAKFARRTWKKWWT